MAKTTEIAPNVFRIATWQPALNTEACLFLVRDTEPLLYHTGRREQFAASLRAVRKLINSRDLRWIAFSDFQADECGALAEWQDEAPGATALCTDIAKYNGVDDVVARRPARAMEDGEELNTGRYQFRFMATPHVPHGWGASMLYEKQHGTLFCSDLLFQEGRCTPTDTADAILDRFLASMRKRQTSDWARAFPCTAQTRKTYRMLAELNPRTLALRHGASHAGSSRILLIQYLLALEEFAATRSVPARAA